jgi:hypothetical protein
MPHAQTWRYIEDDDGESHRKFHLVVEKFEYSVLFGNGDVTSIIYE